MLLTETQNILFRMRKFCRENILTFALPGNLNEGGKLSLLYVRIKLEYDESSNI